jgi:hypothetical protein
MPGKLANDSRLLSSCSAVSFVEEGSKGGREGEGGMGASICCGSCTFVQIRGSVGGDKSFSCASRISNGFGDELSRGEEIGEETGCVCVVIDSSGATDDLRWDRPDLTIFLSAGRNALDI